MNSWSHQGNLESPLKMTMSLQEERDSKVGIQTKGSYPKSWKCKIFLVWDEESHVERSDKRDGSTVHYQCGVPSDWKPLNMGKKEYWVLSSVQRYRRTMRVSKTKGIGYWDLQSTKKVEVIIPTSTKFKVWVEPLFYLFFIFLEDSFDSINKLIRNRPFKHNLVAPVAL